MYYFKTDAEKAEFARQQDNVHDFARWLTESNEQAAVDLRGGVRVFEFCPHLMRADEFCPLCDEDRRAKIERNLDRLEELANNGGTLAEMQAISAENRALRLAAVHN